MTKTLRSDDVGGGGRVNGSRDLVCTDDDGSADSLHGLKDCWMETLVHDRRGNDCCSIMLTLCYGDTDICDDDGHTWSTCCFGICIGTGERCLYKLHPAVDAEGISEDGQQRLPLR